MPFSPAATEAFRSAVISRAPGERRPGVQSDVTRSVSRPARCAKSAWVFA